MTDRSVRVELTGPDPERTSILVQQYGQRIELNGQEFDGTWNEALTQGLHLILKTFEIYSDNWKGFDLIEGEEGDALVGKRLTVDTSGDLPVVTKIEEA
jgi:hypothetical protein